MTLFAVGFLEVNEYMSAKEDFAGWATLVSILVDRLLPLLALAPDRGISSEVLLCWEENNSLMEGRCFLELVGRAESSSLNFLFPDDLDVIPRSGAFCLRDLVIYRKIS